jgi:hypothetical protein
MNPVLLSAFASVIIFLVFPSNPLCPEDFPDKRRKRNADKNEDQEFSLLVSFKARFVGFALM